jgi:hypothetical protein
MAYPRDEGGYILDTDACDVSIGAVLSQILDGQEKVIAEIFKGIYTDILQKRDILTYHQHCHACCQVDVG